MTDIVFRARRTLKVRSAETLPRSTNSVTYLQGNEGGVGKEGRAFWKRGREEEEGGGTRTHTRIEKNHRVRHPHTRPRQDNKEGSWVGGRWGEEFRGGGGDGKQSHTEDKMAAGTGSLTWNY